MKDEELIRSPEALKELVNRFNGFHDGFIKRLSLTSFDEFEQEPGSNDQPRVSQIMTGKFDLIIDLAHHNYSHGRANRIVQLHFRGASNVRFQTLEPSNWAINELNIESGQTRRAEFLSEGKACLALSFESVSCIEL